MVELKVLNPVAEAKKEAAVGLAPRLKSLDGKTVGFWWNFKPSGDALNKFTAEALASKFKDIRFKHYVGSVGDMIRRASPGNIEQVAKEVDAVVGAHGD
jgi:hypothetical protein